MVQKKYWILASLLLILLTLVGAVTYLSSLKRMSNTATLRKSVGISTWGNSIFTIPKNEHNWGELDGGIWYNFTCWIKSEANVPINISFTTKNWIPENMTYEWKVYVDRFGWNPTAFILYKNESTYFDFFLKIDSMPDYIFNFSFDIEMNSTECIP